MDDPLGDLPPPRTPPSSGGLLSRGYDGTLAAGKTSALFGMAMTEKQDGSDLRANTTRAEPIGDGGYDSLATNGLLVTHSPWTRRQRPPPPSG